jgi:hypothetical protein
MYPPTQLATPVVNHNRGYGYGVAGVTGTMAAGLAQDSIVFALFNGAQGSVNAADQLHLYLERLRLAFTTIAAFTTAITAGRRLGIYRATGVAATGGTALTVAKKDTNAPATVVADARIATTAALGVVGITREAAPIALLDLVHVGAAGARQDFLFELATPLNCEEAIAPGELLVVSNPVAMDAGGTWQLSVDECHWVEAKRFVK